MTAGSSRCIREIRKLSAIFIAWTRSTTNRLRRFLILFTPLDRTKDCADGCDQHYHFMNKEEQLKLFQLQTTQYLQRMVKWCVTWSLRRPHCEKTDSVEFVYVCSLVRNLCTSSKIVHISFSSGDTPLWTWEMSYDYIVQEEAIYAIYPSVKVPTACQRCLPHFL